MEERHQLRKEASDAASRSAKGAWVPPGQLTASPRRDKAPREEQHGLKAAAGAQRSQPYSTSRLKLPAATQPTQKQAGIPTAAVRCMDTLAASKGSISGGNSSAGGQRYSVKHQQQQNSSSSYTAALLKRQAAAALQKSAPGSPRGAATSAAISTGQGSTLHIHQQQQQHGTNSLAALATKLQGMGGYISRSAAAVAAAAAVGSPPSGNTSPRQRQQQQQHALNVCNGSRHSSSGSASSASSGSYAAQASSRSALLSATGAVTHRTTTDGQYTCTTVTADQQQQQQNAAGMGAYSHQLSSALSAVTAANTAAAAMLRAVALEAAKTAGAVSLQHAGESSSAAAGLIGSSNPAGYHSSSRGSSSLQGQHPVVPALQLNSQQQQQQQRQQQQDVYQPVSTRIRLAAAQAVAHIDGSYQRSPSAAVAPVETAVTSAAAQAAAAAAASNGSVLASSMTAEAEAGSTAVVNTAGVTLLPIKTLAATAAVAAAAGDDSAGTEWVETPRSPAGGIGYSKLRRLHTTSCAGSAAAVAAAAAAGSPRHVAPPEEQLLPAAAAAAAYASSEGISSETTHSSLRLRQQQRQQSKGSAGDHWTSEDVVMGWYQYSDEDESSEQVSSLGFVPATHTAAAAGEGSPYHSPDSPRLSFQQPFGSIQTLPAAAATRLLTTSSGGIEYAKLLRTQTGSPAATPRHTRFQQQQQAEVTGSSPSGSMGFRKSSEHAQPGVRMTSKLVTGWYGSGLHSIGSDSSCGNSPEPCYADPQQQTRGMCAEVPHTCRTVQYSMSSGGGAVPAVAEVTTAPAVRAGGTDSSGGWSSDGFPGWGLAPYPTVLSASGAGGPLVLAVGATLGLTAQDAVLSLPRQGLHLHSSSNPGVVAGESSGGASRTSGGGAAPLGSTMGTFDLRPCVGAPLLSTRDASVTELLEASQAQIDCMETTLVSMLQVAKRWTEGGMCEPGMEESLRERFSSTF